MNARADSKAGLTSREEKMNTNEADITAINELYDQWCIAANAGDLDHFMSLWADDAILMNPDAPAIFGKEQIRAFYQTIFEEFSFEATIYGETEVQVSGDLAFSRGTGTSRVTPKDGGATTFSDAKWLDILKKQADGSWKVYCDCVTNNAPPKIA
jgi:uncharacterized protein (TIGR02246 family)